MSALTVSPENGATTLFGTLVSDMQTGISIANGKITGTLKYIDGGIASSGPLAGSGNFLALKFTNIDADATSVMVGLDPSAGTGLVELINDPDKNGVFKITDHTRQKFKVISKVGDFTYEQTYDLSELTCNTSA